MAKRLRAVRLDDTVWEALRERAKGCGTSMTALIEEALERTRGPQEWAHVAEQIAGDCRRCGHGQASHWAKGCLVGCACSETRYVAP